MAYIPGVANDIFISYARLDDEPLGNQRGWVDAFSQALSVRLGQLLGESPQIWRDTKLFGNDVFANESVNAIRNSAILLCLVSPSYVRSEWCMRELQTFITSRPSNIEGSNDPRANVFKLVLSPVPYSQQPKELEDHLGFEFFLMDPITGSARQLRQASGKDTELAFWDRLDRVAHQIAESLSKLLEIRSSHSVPSEPSKVTNEIAALTITDDSNLQRKLRVFLCHSSDDKPQVRLIYRLLASFGADPWLDEEKLLPGQRWELEIPKAVRASDAIIVCISKNASTRVGYLQKELRQALDVADEQPEDAVFLIPARLEDCKIPERLSGRQWVNLFEERGNDLLVRALRARATQLSVERLVNARPN